MKLNKIFLSMAALVFVGAMTAGCSGDDLTAETPQLPDTAGGTVVTKVTVSLDEHASTRALAANGTKTFAAGDKIAVIYKNTAGETMKAESAALNSFDILSSNSAKFSVTLTNPQASTPVRYIYPAAMAVAPIATDAAIDDASTIDYTKLATQDGTLTKLGSDFDLAVFDGTMTAQAVLPAAELKNPLTIGKFTIENSGGTDITNTITKLTISDGTNTYTVNPATLSNIYVAMKPIISSQTIVVQATDGTTHYVKTVTGKTLAKNNITPVNVTMFAGTPASSAAAADKGKFLGADGFIYADAAAATATGTTLVALICYVGDDAETSASNTAYKHGLALALTDASTSAKWCSQTSETCLATQYISSYREDMAGIANTDALIAHGSHTHAAASMARNYNSGTHPIGTSAWFLPSSGQWNKMITTAGDYTTLGSNANLQGWYWSSTESGVRNIWIYAFTDYGGGCVGDPKDSDNHVRSALAF